MINLFENTTHLNVKFCWDDYDFCESTDFRYFWSDVNIFKGMCCTCHEYCVFIFIFHAVRQIGTKHTLSQQTVSQNGCKYFFFLNKISFGSFFFICLCQWSILIGFSNFIWLNDVTIDQYNILIIVMKRYFLQSLSNKYWEL